MFQQVFLLSLLIHHAFPDCQCGLRTQLGRVLGGENAQPGQYPWQAFIIKYQGGNRYHCGGSIINSEWILTAAHCLPNSLTGNNEVIQRDILVRVGRVRNEDLVHVLQPWVNYRRNLGPLPNITTLNENGLFLVDRWVSQIDNPNKDSDIGLLHVWTPIKFSTTTRPVCLEPPKSTQNFYPTVELSGWGYTSDDYILSDRLKWATVSEVKYEDCSWYFQSMPFKMNPLKQIFFNRGSPGGCPGDSGSPYVVKKNGRFHQIAVMSGGDPINNCSEKSVERLGVRVAYFYDWIKKMANSGTWCSP